MCPQILDQLTIGRVGVAQLFLLAQVSRAPRVGGYVAEQIDDDHLHPHHRGGITEITNGGLGCGHHNR